MGNSNRDGSTPSNSGEMQLLRSSEELVTKGHDATAPHELSPSGLSAQLVAPASLVIVGGSAAGRVFALSGAECVIGRSAHATIAIADRAISTRHAIVRRCSHGHELVDLGSTNGTMLNGSRLAPRQPVELHPGDLIQVAEISLVYLAEGMTDAQEVTQALSALPVHSATRMSPSLNADDVLLQILKLSMPPEEPPKASLEDNVERAVQLMKLAGQFLPLIATFATIVGLLGIGSVVLFPPYAESKFTMVLTPKATENPIEDRRPMAAFDFFSGAESNFVSPALVESTLTKLGITHPARTLVETIAGNLSLVNLSPDKTFASIAPTAYSGTYKHRSEAESLRFLTTHVENYLASEIKKTLTVIQKQVDFLEATAREKEAELRTTESKIKDFQSKYQDSLPQFSGGHVTSLESLRQRQADLLGKSQGASSAVLAAKRELDRMAPREQAKVTRTSPYQIALSQTRVALADARSKGLGESHPDVLKLKAQIAQYEELSAKELEKAPSQVEMAGNPEIAALRHDLALKEVDAQAVSAELAQVSGQIARLEKIVKDMPAVAATYAELTRSYDITTATHKRLLQELESTRVQLNLERASTEKRYEVTAPPVSYPPPMRRTLAKRAGIGTGIGAAAAIALIAIRQLRAWYRGIPQRRAKALAKGSIVGANKPLAAPRSLPAPPQDV